MPLLPLLRQLRRALALWQRGPARWMLRAGLPLPPPLPRTLLLLRRVLRRPRLNLPPGPLLLRLLLSKAEMCRVAAGAALAWGAAARGLLGLKKRQCRRSQGGRRLVQE